MLCCLVRQQPVRSGQLEVEKLRLSMKVSMPLRGPFDVISSTVDLNDPAEHDNAQRFMANALGRVIGCFPDIAYSAASTSKQYLEGSATADEVLAVRVRLWESLRGRDQSDEPDVLRIRAAICALHGMT